MSSKKSNNPVKRRSSSRRGWQASFINVAEVRREVSSALNLHRSSSSSCSSSRRGSNYKYAMSKATGAGYQHCCYSILENLPFPEPTWSTTAPSVLAAPSVATPPPLESFEFEWGESLAASYTWWLGFLKTLDGKNKDDSSKYSFEENGIMKNSWVFGQRQDGSKLAEQPCLDANDQTSYLDEWLIIPPTEDVCEMSDPLENAVGLIQSSQP